MNEKPENNPTRKNRASFLPSSENESFIAGINYLLKNNDKLINKFEKIIEENYNNKLKVTIESTVENSYKAASFKEIFDDRIKAGLEGNNDKFKELIKQIIEGSYRSGDFKENLEKQFNLSVEKQKDGLKTEIKNVVQDSYKEDHFKNAIINSIEEKFTSLNKLITEKTRRNGWIDIGLGVGASIAFGILLYVCSLMDNPFTKLFKDDKESIKLQETNNKQQNEIKELKKIIDSIQIKK